MSTALEVPSQLTVANPNELLRIAVSQNADIDKLSKLLELQLRWEANEARKAFVTAMNAFKASPPEIRKNKHIKVVSKEGKLGGEYDHATLDHVCDAVTGGLSKHGISHRWKVEQTGEWIKVTCILTHELGHSEETALQGTADQTGSKNSIQAIGSTVTYLQRYTLLAATGLAASNGDNDGNSGGKQGSRLTDERFVQLRDGIANAGNKAELELLYKAAIKEAESLSDQDAMRDFNKTKNQHYRELHNAGR